MTESKPKRAKRIKPDPELVKLAAFGQKQSFETG